MRPSLTIFAAPRRLASEVLKTAQSKIIGGQSEQQVFFGELPPILQRFFKQYPPSPFRKYATEPRATNDPEANPFLANRHPVTQRWHKPRYSMRRQADLWKAAYRFGIQHLMPQLLHNRKFYEERYDSQTPMAGSRFFKLTKRERRAPERAREVEEAVAQLDAKIVERKGKRFEKYLQDKNKVGHV